MAKSITFNADMVKVSLAGNKRQTRRPLKNQPLEHADTPRMFANGKWLFHYNNETEYVCPYGKVGDTLWVRETFQVGLCTKSSIAYRATHNPSDLEEGQDEIIKWKSPIHMPQWASRISLKITDIRIEKIQNVSECGAQAEGAKPSFKDEFGIVHTQPSYRDGFILNIWNKIYHDKHKPEFSWNENPWVWVIDFEVIK